MSRSSHEEMTAHLIAELADLKQERQILLDRLATLGLGGPLFHLPTQEQEEEEEEENDAEQKAARILNRLRALRPSQQAAAITRKNQRDHRNGRSVWAAPVAAAIEQAEELGKTLA